MQSEIYHDCDVIATPQVMSDSGVLYPSDSTNVILNSFYSSSQI